MSRFFRRSAVTAIILGMTTITFVNAASPVDDYKKGMHKVTTSNWMSHLPDDLPLSEVNFPGTHDTATFAGVSTPAIVTCGGIVGLLSAPFLHVLLPVGYIAENIVLGSVRCQSRTIKEQLDEGIRVFDIRLARHKGSSDPRAFHGVVPIDITFTGILDECQKFLTDNPSEGVLMFLKKEDAFSPSPVIYPQKLRI